MLSSRFLGAVHPPYPSIHGLLTAPLSFLLLKEKTDDEKFAAAFEGINLAMVLVDPNGNIKLLNSSAESLVQYTRSELLGQPIEKVIPRLLEDVKAHHAGLDASGRWRHRLMEDYGGTLNEEALGYLQRSRVASQTMGQLNETVHAGRRGE